MFHINLNDSNCIEVKTKKHSYQYATDGHLPNPLEATYAALAGCAAVYLKKAALKFNKSTEGTTIMCRSVIHPSNPAVPTRWITQINFAPTWTEDEKNEAIRYVEQCAVKELIKNGHSIQFEVEADQVSTHEISV